MSQQGEEEVDGWEGKNDPDDEYANEEVDPRVEQYLEQMNKATDDINKHENKYDEIKAAFQAALSKIEADLGKTAQRVGRKTVERARPYFESLAKAQRAHYESRRTAKHFEDLSSAYLEAKHAVAAVEKRAEQLGKMDEALQSELNQANSRFIRADLRRKKAETLHMTKTSEFQEADRHLNAVLKQRKKSVVKARPYYEAKARFDKIIRALKVQLLEQEKATKEAKGRCQHAMAMLQQISEEIHQRREAERAKRQNGTERAGTDASDRQPDQDSSHATDRIQRELAEAQRIQAEQAKRQEEHEQDTRRLLEGAARVSEDRHPDLDDAVSTTSTETPDGSELDHVHHVYDDTDDINGDSDDGHGDGDGLEGSDGEEAMGSGYEGQDGDGGKQCNLEEEEDNKDGQEASDGEEMTQHQDDAQHQDEVQQEPQPVEQQQQQQQQQQADNQDRKQQENGGERGEDDAGGEDTADQVPATNDTANHAEVHEAEEEEEETVQPNTEEQHSADASSVDAEDDAGGDERQGSE